MATGELSLYESGIWIIPLFLIGTLAGMFVLIRSWQTRVKAAFKTIQGALRNFQKSFKQFDTILQHYSIEDREPFGSEIKALSARLESLGQRVVRLQEEYIELREEASRLSLGSRKLLVGAVFFVFPWLALRRKVGVLEREIARLATDYEGFDQSIQVLVRRGWDVAGQARQVIEKERHLQRMLQGLSKQHIQGEAFEAAVQREQELAATLERIPSFFIDANEDEVIAQADKESISDVFEILGEAEPAVEKLSLEAQSWEHDIQETGQRVADLRKALSEVEGFLPSLPAELVIEPYQARLKQLSTIAGSLTATLSRLELESITEVSQEAERVRVAAGELGEQLKRSRRQLVALQRILEELAAGLKTLSAQFGALGTQSIHPIAWNISRSRLTELSRQAAELGNSKKPRLPEQVDKDLAAASALLSNQKELARHCQRIGEQHGELVRLRQSPELQEAEGWFRGAASLAGQASVYSPDNWTRTDSVGSLGAELDNLAENHTRLASGELSRPVQEAELAQELEAVRGLVEQHRVLRARVERVKSRLTELQELEKGLRDSFQAARTVLSQVELLARSNDFLNSIAMAEIGALRSQLEQRGNELGQRRQGLVDDKARALNALLTQISSAANGWLDRLNLEIEGKKKTLAEKLETLDEIATLDERAVMEAGGLLSRDLPVSMAQRSRQKSAFALDEIVGQLKPRSDTWQSCMAALRAIEDLEKPLVETYQYALQQYDGVRELLLRAADWLPGRRAWPPTSISLETEVQEFKNLETQWQGIAKQPGRAITVVRQLSDLSAKFQSLGGRVEQKFDRAEAEQTRIHDLEEELDNLARRWQALGQQYPESVGEIRSLNAQIVKEVETLKRQYRQGAIAYADVLQSLGFICQNVQNEPITLEDGRVIRLDGQGYQNFRRRV